MLNTAIADDDDGGEYGGDDGNAGDGLYRVGVRKLCEFAAKAGDLDLRFTPSPTAQQGREGHTLVANRRAPGYEAEVELSGSFQNLRISGRADGFDAAHNQLEEIKTYRGTVESIGPHQRALHWAQLKVYGWLLCQSRQLPEVTLSLVYFEVVDKTEHPLREQHSAASLQQFAEALCARFHHWALDELAHRRQRDAVLQTLAFPQLPFRTGQHALASSVYRTCTQSGSLLAQASTGIGKTIGTVYPALRAMPVRGTDKLFFLTAKTPGRQVALQALQAIRGTPATVPLRVLELVARDKACEHKDKACHGQSCPLAQGFYDRLPAARRAAAQQAWLDQTQLRSVALQHSVCPYYLGQEMARWSDVVVGDYNHYFDRSALLHALALEGRWRTSLLVDEAHNLYSRACGMYSADLSQAETVAVRPALPRSIRRALDELLRQWQRLDNTPADNPATSPTSPAWQLLDAVPDDWLRCLQRLNSAIGEYLNDHPTDAHGALLPFYFRTLGFAALAEAFDNSHSMCELQRPEAGTAAAAVGIGDAQGQLLPAAPEHTALQLVLRNIVPAAFLAPRIQAADAIVLFSATLHPADYYINLLGLPETTHSIDIGSPFRAEQLAVRVLPLSTRRDDRAATLDLLVDSMAAQWAAQPGNYLAFFSSFDYLEQARQRLQQRAPQIAVWSQDRVMDEPRRSRFLQQFHSGGQGIGFAVLGGVFGEGVDLPGRRLVGAFIATLGLPQFDEVHQAICQRMQQRFGRGYDYTYLLPGLQKVVQAAGRVIRTETDVGTVLLMDERYRQPRYRQLLPGWWQIQPG